MKGAKTLALFLLVLACITLSIRSRPILSFRSTSDLSVSQAGIVSATGTVYASGGGRTFLCRGSCIRLFGSQAQNGSEASVIGVLDGEKKSLTVVRESWTFRS